MYDYNGLNPYHKVQNANFYKGILNSERHACSWKIFLVGKILVGEFLVRKIDSM